MNENVFQCKDGIACSTGKHWKKRILLPIGFKLLTQVSMSEALLGKWVLKICSKVTGEHPCQSLIYWNHTLASVFSCKFSAYF